jgi:hypothetical protein
MSHNSAEPSQLGVTRRIAVVTRESVIKLGRLLLGIIRRGLLDGWRVRIRPGARRMRDRIARTIPQFSKQYARCTA